MKTEEIKTGGAGGGGSFTNYKLQPGTQVVYIEKFELRYATWASAAPGEVGLSMHCIGPDIEGFEGFAYDKDDASKGKRKHQVGFVKSSRFNYADKVHNGKEIDRDFEIGRFMGEVMDALGCRAWMNAIDPEGIMNLDLWFDRINASDAPWRNQPLRVCISARQYWKSPADKYAQQDLSVVKWVKDTVRMESGNIPEAESKVVVWDKDNIDHMERAAKPQEVAGFQGKATPAPTAAGAPAAEEDLDDLPF